MQRTVGSRIRSTLEEALTHLGPEHRHLGPPEYVPRPRALLASQPLPGWFVSTLKSERAALNSPTLGLADLGNKRRISLTWRLKSHASDRTPDTKFPSQRDERSRGTHGKCHGWNCGPKAQHTGAHGPCQQSEVGPTTALHCRLWRSSQRQLLGETGILHRRKNFGTRKCGAS